MISGLFTPSSPFLTHDAGAHILLRHFNIAPRKLDSPARGDACLMLEQRVGIHSQHADLYALLCSMMGIDTICVRGAIPVPPSLAPELKVDYFFRRGMTLLPHRDTYKCCEYIPEAHTWNLLYLDGVWTHVDSFSDDIRPQEDKDPHYGFFALTDEDLMKHVPGRVPASGMEDQPVLGVDARVFNLNRCWPKEEYPHATEKSSRYDVKFDLTFATIQEMLSEAKKRRHQTQHAILLEAHVEEVANMASLVERPDIVRDTLRRAVGLDDAIVDFTEDGKVSMLLK